MSASSTDGAAGGVEEAEAHRRTEIVRATKALSLGAVLGIFLAWWARGDRQSPI